MSGDNFASVMNLANKYDVPKCLAACKKLLNDILAPDNMLWIYEMARFYDLKDLVTSCEEKIQLDPKSIFDSPSFKICDRAVLKNVLNINLICDELTVFDACMAWAKKACERENVEENTENFKKMLGDCFELIRFPSMSNEQFCMVLANYDDFFDKDTLADIFMNITLKRPLKVATQFNGNSRQKELILIRYGKGAKVGNHTVQQEEVMKFSTNQRILLKGIVINDKINSLLKTKLSGNITILHLECSTGEVLLNQSILLSNVNSNFYDFRKLVVIYPQQKYEIRILFDTILEGITYAVQVEKYEETVTLNEGLEVKFESCSDAGYDMIMYGLISGFHFIQV